MLMRRLIAWWRERRRRRGETLYAIQQDRARERRGHDAVTDSAAASDPGVAGVLSGFNQGNGGTSS
jgi:hypothetical protein